MNCQNVHMLHSLFVNCVDFKTLIPRDACQELFLFFSVFVPSCKYCGVESLILKRNFYGSVHGEKGSVRWWSLEVIVSYAKYSFNTNRLSSRGLAH